jgi:hypothetical protein
MVPNSERLGFARFLPIPVNMFLDCTQIKEFHLCVFEIGK